MLIWFISGYVATMATLVMSFRIEWTSREVISRNFEKMKKMLKFYLGTIKNESAASDLPPEGPPKQRWVELSRISMIWRPAYLDFSNLASKS